MHGAVVAVYARALAVRPRERGRGRASSATRRASTRGRWLAAVDRAAGGSSDAGRRRRCDPTIGELQASTCRRDRGRAAPRDADGSRLQAAAAATARRGGGLARGAAAARAPRARTLLAGGGSPPALPTLVGLGEGLTPSADDAVVGVLAGLDVLGLRVLRAGLVAALPADIEARTPRVSAQALRAAADGMYGAPLLALLEALAAGKPADRAAADLSAVGHRSGRDTLLGLAAALARRTPEMTALR